MKKTIIVIILFIIGIFLISYPFFSNLINLFHQTKVIKNYREEVDKLSEDKKQEMMEKATKYNDELERDNYIDVSLNENKNQDAPSYLNLLDLGEAMAYIVIPKIDINLPIYHGISEDVLQNGVGHIESSSLPIGGKSTHCVLTGHTGIARGKIFDNINQLVIGDLFYISVLGNILAYKVDDIKIVEPSDTEAIRIEEDKDYVTLVTCTPYMINSHRLLVRGERVDAVAIQDEESNKDNQLYNLNEYSDDIIEKNMDFSNIIIMAAILLLIIFLFIIHLMNKNKKA